MAKFSEMFSTIEPQQNPIDAADKRNQTSQLVKQLFQLQEQRMDVYKTFEEGFKIYMSTAPSYDFIKFRSLVRDVTKDFKRISEGIVAIEKSLRQSGHTEVADLIVLLQADEEKRLKLAAKYQLSRQTATDNPTKPDFWNEVASAKTMYNQSVEAVQERVDDLRYETEGLILKR